MLYCQHSIMPGITQYIAGIAHSLVVLQSIRVGPDLCVVCLGATAGYDAADGLAAGHSCTAAASSTGSTTWLLGLAGGQ